VVVVEAKHVSKRFGDILALDDVSVRFREGIVTVLLGPSGCGKTTFLRCIAGLERPDSGDVLVGDQIVSSTDKFVPPSKRGVGMVFQSYAIWPHMSVFENVAYPLKLLKVPQDEIHKRVNTALILVELQGLEKRGATELSGGQQQRVALARALVYSPRLLLLDEPLSNLDAKLRESTRFELRELQSRLRTTMIYVTHDQAEALVLADQVVVMNKGRIEEISTPEQLYRNPKSMFAAQFIGSSNLIQAVVLACDADQREAFARTEGGCVIKICTSTDLKPNLQVTLGIRPEDIILHHSSVGGAGALVGKVRSRAFLGNVTELNVEVEGIGNLRVQERSDADLREGDSVSVSVDPARVLAFGGSF
jgi:iron(III) transport system ATP-binding protein